MKKSSRNKYKKKKIYKSKNYKICSPVYNYNHIYKEPLTYNYNISINSTDDEIFDTLKIITHNIKQELCFSRIGKGSLGYVKQVAEQELEILNTKLYLKKVIVDKIEFDNANYNDINIEYKITRI